MCWGIDVNRSLNYFTSINDDSLKKIILLLKSLL